MATAAASTIRWGIIGCGDVTEVKSGPAFQQAQGSELVAGDAAARRAGGRLRAPPRRAALVRRRRRADRRPGVDAVYIATPPGAHERLALEVCAAGKPAYVEKPMARNHAECRRMIAAFAAAGVPLFVAYYRRALPRFVRARELVAAGALGRSPASATACRVRTTATSWRACAGHAPALAPAGRARGRWAVSRPRLPHAGHPRLHLGPLEEARGAAANLATPLAVEDAVAMSFRTRGARLGLPTGTSPPPCASTRSSSPATGRVAALYLRQRAGRAAPRAAVERFDLPNPRTSSSR